MGGLTSAVDWWEEWQLRVLVLCSLAIQCLLFLFSFMRRSAIPGFFRFMMWLAYLAGDAVAIYALATLFNRHKTDEPGGSGSTLLEVVWAPVLLLHLGGHDGFTACNIEDNELWSRHLLTALSQVTVAIYVFCKSWPPGGGDKRLLQAAILLFVPGVFKCFLKPWALKSASIYSLVSSRAASVNQNEAGEMYGLEEYVSKAKKFIFQQKQDEDRPRCNNEPDDGIKSDLLASGRMEPVWRSTACGMAAISRLSRVKGGFMENLRGTLEWQLMEYVRRAWDFVQELFKTAGASPPQGGSFCGRLRERLREREIEEKQKNDLVKEMIEGRSGACKLFVDLSSPFSRRLSILQDFWVLREERAYGSVRQGLATAFLLLYTKLKTAGCVVRRFIQILRVVLPWAAIGLFHQSHSRETQMMINGGIDVKITYAMICCTAVLETYSGFSVMLTPTEEAGEEWPEMVAQYSLIGYFAHNKKHSMMMWIASLLGCNDFLDQHWCMEESCFSSATISELVLRYLKDGWRNKIEDAASYRRFNDHHGRSEGLLRLSLSSTNRNRNRNRPLLFDESVLLWHIATEFCFFSSSLSEHSKKCAFAKIPTWTERFPDLTSFSGQGIKPRFAPVSHSPEEKPTTEKMREMVPSISQTSSTGKNDQPTSGCDQEFACCKAVLCRQMSNYMVYHLFVNPEMLLPGSRRNLFKTAYDELKDDILKDWEWNPVCWSRCMPCGVKLMKEEEIVMRRLIEVMQESERSSQEAFLSMEGSNKDDNFIHQAWALAQSLLQMEETERWKEIQDVWVQMLCFSASRCRGYLHAKALAKGGEFLSYVWLLLFHMGMETFTDKLQREEQDLLPRASHDEAGSNDTDTAGLQREHLLISQGGNQQYGTPSASEIREVAVNVV